MAAMKHSTAALAALLAFLLPSAASAKEQTKDQGMVSAADPRAAAAGAEILREGGTAADAAIAMMAALGVVEPGHSGIGGGGFMVYYSAGQHKTFGYDAREAAPMAADDRWFFGPDGKPMPIYQAIPGGRSVGVPGELRLMEIAHEKHGKLAWNRLFQPAIRLAADGWKITPRLYNFVARSPKGFLTGWPTTYLFNPDGTAKPAGTTVKNPDLAALLGQIAAHGPDYLYTGPVARNIVAAVNGAARNPSKMTAGDLAAYQAHERTPVCGTYRSYRICGMAPPASGGVSVLQILKQLERFDMAKLGKDSPIAWHLFAQSSRLAYADRDAWLADPDHVKVPVAGLLTPDYIAARSALISEAAGSARAEPGKPAGAPQFARAEPQPEHGTSDLVAVDRWGNVAQATVTIESVFGSGLTTNGFFLNNQLTDFNLNPVRDGYLTANRVEGGKRPRSSMSPTIVYDAEGKVRLAIGAAGGSTIIAQVAKALIAVLDWGMSAQDAIALGLVYAPGPTTVLEKGTAAEALAPGLQALGEQVTIAPLGLKANAIERVDGTWMGAADPRSEGVAMREDGEVRAIIRANDPNRPSE